MARRRIQGKLHFCQTGSDGSMHQIIKSKSLRCPYFAPTISIFWGLGWRWVGMFRPHVTTFSNCRGVVVRRCYPSRFVLIIMTSSNINNFHVPVPFVWVIHRSRVDSPHKGTITWTVDVSILVVSTNCWTNTQLTGNSMHHDGHFTSL